MKTKLLILFLVLLVPNRNLFLQEIPDSCLKLICPNDYDLHTNTGSVNPDSVRVDSCENSPTFGKIFTKKYFDLKFEKYPFESVIQANEIKSVNDISDSIAGLKQQLELMEQEFGNIHFIRQDPYSVDFHDSVYYQSGVCVIYFDEYQDINAVKIFAEQNITSLIWFNYIINYGVIPGVVEENQLENHLIFHINSDNELVLMNIEDRLVSIEIFSILGNRIMKADNLSRIDINFLSKGAYFLKYKNNFYKFLKM